jgi:hypothetical protein
MLHIINPGMGGGNGFEGNANCIGGNGVVSGITTIHNAIGVSIKKT